MDTHTLKKFTYGITTGCISTVLFNPIDRVLYLMVKNKKSFFDINVWKNPYLGVSQALYSRVIGYGLYFPFFEFYKSKTKSTFQSGILTGLTTTIFNHPMNVIKMYNWNNNDNKISIRLLANKIYIKYGILSFFRGMHYTFIRDALFSTIFFKLSEKYNKQKSLLNDTIYASIATIISSPINYCRSAMYFNFNDNPKFKHIAQELIDDVKKIKNRKIYYLLHNKLNIGFGTMRVGIGIAVSKYIYDILVQANDTINEKLAHHTNTEPSIIISKDVEKIN